MNNFNNAKMNYTQNIKCDDIKPIEHKFFRFLIKQLDYPEVKITKEGRLISPVRYLATDFSKKYNVSYNQLLYFLKKWNKIGFYKYETVLDFGWFDNISDLMFGTIDCYYPYKRYMEIIPRRVKIKCLNLKEDKNMNFGEALEKVKNGCKIAREEWNGKGMFVYLVPAGNFKPYTPIAESLVNDEGLVPYNPYFAIKNVNGTISTWVPSVNDCLAEDWYVL